MDPNWMSRCDANLARMARVMGRLGIGADPVQGLLGTLDWAHAVRGCALCRMDAECTDWLSGGAGEEALRRFCPNANYFSRERDPAQPIAS